MQAMNVVSSSKRKPDSPLSSPIPIDSHSIPSATSSSFASSSAPSPVYSILRQSSHIDSNNHKNESASIVPFTFESQPMISSHSQPLPCSSSRDKERHHHGRPRVRRRLSEAGDSIGSFEESSSLDRSSRSNSSSISSMITSNSSFTSAPVSPSYTSGCDQSSTSERPMKQSLRISTSPGPAPSSQVNTCNTALLSTFTLASPETSIPSLPQMTSTAGSSLDQMCAPSADQQHKPKRALNRKKLSLLVVPSSSQPSGTKSCPPSPLDGAALSTLEPKSNTPNRTGLDLQNMDSTMSISSSLRGAMSMRRRTSLPKLNLSSAAFSSGFKSGKLLATSTASEFGRDADFLRDSSDAVRIITRSEVVTDRNNLSRNGQQPDSFPYESGPIEILPGLYLGSEQNAKDPKILSSLGISAVLNVAKEVICPWTAQEVIVEEEEELESNIDVDESDSPDEDVTLQLRPAAIISSIVPPRPSLMHDRSLLIRPATSTPNLQYTYNRHSPGSSSPPKFSSSRTPLTRNMSASSIMPGPETIHKRFPADSRTGCPAVEYMKLPWNHDQADLCEQFVGVFAFLDRIRNANGKVLVHCQCGVSRSASLVIGYVMQDRKAEKLGMNDAYSYVKDKSEWVSPNLQLIYQLVEWEKKLKESEGESAVKSPLKRNSDEMDCDLSDPSSSPTTSNSSTESRLHTPAGQIIDPVAMTSVDGNLLSPTLAQHLVITPQLANDIIPTTKDGLSIHSSPFLPS